MHFTYHYASHDDNAYSIAISCAAKAQQRAFEFYAAARASMRSDGFLSGGFMRLGDQYAQDAVEWYTVAHSYSGAYSSDVWVSEELDDEWMPSTCPKCGTGLMFTDIDDRRKYNECSNEACRYQEDLEWFEPGIGWIPYEQHYKSIYSIKQSTPESDDRYPEEPDRTWNEPGYEGDGFSNDYTDYHPVHGYPEYPEDDPDDSDPDEPISPIWYES